MTLREYRPIGTTSKVKKEQLEQTKSTFSSLWTLMDPKPHHCLQIEGYTLIRSDIVQSGSIISVKTLDKKKKQEILKSYPKRLHLEIKKLNEELNLTQTHLKNLKKEVETKEVKQLEMTEQIKLLKEKAYDLRAETDNKNSIKNFRNRYSRFNECLSEDLKVLDPEVKNEFLNLLNDLKLRIEEVSPYLKLE